MARTSSWFPVVMVLAMGCTEDKGLDTASIADDVDSGVSSEDAPSSEDVAFAIDRDAMWSHLEALYEIAMDNDGNRAAGSSGYDASVAYVSAQLADVGYTVSSLPFTINTEQWNADPVLATEGTDPETFVLFEQFAPFRFGGSGDVSAEIQAVDIAVPPDPDQGTNSGCEADDFDGFVAGRIALLQRGECTFQTKSDLAVAAGATAVLIFNEGTDGRQDLYQGTLDSTADNPVPIFSLSYGLGATLSEMAAGQTLRVVADVSRVDTPTENVMVETDGDAERVVVVGAHLDSVEAGPGINDNGSGVALVLELARVMKREGIEPANQIRFVLWGGEELGLLGSMDYVFSLDETAHQRIMANLNFDMVASPNPVRFVYDGDGSDLGQAGPIGSAAIESMFTDWFDENDLDWAPTAFDGRSDYGPFIWSDIPAGGLFTGAEIDKSPAEALYYGGEAGEPYDPCYHQECDTLDNVDMDMLEEMAAAASQAVMTTGNRLDGLGLSARTSPRFDVPVSVDVPQCGASHEHQLRWRQ